MSVYVYACFKTIVILQGIRERLIGDFAVIKSLCPDPRLISDSCDPKMLGACKGTAS